MASTYLNWWTPMHSRSGPRRRHSSELKAAVLAACNEPGASISGVALAHGLNANLVRKWRTGRGLKRAGGIVEPSLESQTPRRPTPATSPRIGTIAEFVAIEMPAQPKTTADSAADKPSVERTTELATAPFIDVQLRRGPLHLSVRWPTSAARDCTAWLSELSSGLLK